VIKHTEKRNTKELPLDVFYLGKVWKVVGRQTTAQGEPWLQLKQGFCTAIAKEYEVETTRN